MLIKLAWLATVWWKNYDNMLSCFHLIPGRPTGTSRTVRRTDGRTNGQNSYINIARDKNASSRCFWQKMKSWWGWRHWSKYQCDVFNFVDLCSGVSIVWSTTTRTQVSDANAVTFSVKCFNQLKLYPLSGNIFRKWFASYFLFIHEHLLIMWSPTVNLIDCCNDTFTDVRFSSLLAKNV